MNTTKSGSSVKRVLCGFMLALCLAGIGAGTVEAAGDKRPALKAPKPSCSKACGRIKVTQEDGTTVQCGGAAQGGPSGCLCKCGDAVVATTPK
jgi:hypothetical protein